MTMRVLIVSATNRRRGAEIQAVGVAQSLKDAGWEVRHVALQGDPHRDDILFVDVLGGNWRSWKVLWHLRQLISSSDVVVAFGSFALPASVIATIGLRTPVIYRSIGDPQQWLRGVAHRWRTGLLVRRVQHVVALWPGAAESIQRLYRLRRERVTVIPNARSSSDFSEETEDERIAARTVFGLNADEVVLSIIGSLSEEKCVERAINVVALDTSLRLLIAGDGPLRETLEANVKGEAKDRIIFLGNVDDPRLVYAASDVVLITSRTEGMPGVAIEAGLSGIPIVSTDVGSIREVISDGESGRIVSSATPESLLEAIHDVLLHREDLGRQARVLCASRFTWEVVAPQWVETITAVTNARPDKVRT